MRILLVHNFYGSSVPSGESAVVQAERRLLEERGCEVERFYRYSDNIRDKGLLGMIEGGVVTPWNPFSARDIKKLVEAQRFDIVHVHNTFPLISPAIFSAIGGRAAKVLTLHNYRLFCPAGIPMRGGRVCTLCIENRTVLPAIGYGCYRGSRFATLPLAASVSLHRRLGTWEKYVDAFVALSEFQLRLMTRAGIPRELLHVKPNFFPGNPHVVAWEKRDDAVVFVGRISSEKGVKTLIRAWQAWGDAPELRIVGDGPLLSEIKALVEKYRLNVRFVGRLVPAKVLEEISRARLLILPSEWFEGFPMVIREAFAYGTPVAVSNIGALGEIVEDGVTGVLFNPGDHSSLVEVVESIWRRQGHLGKMAGAAREIFEQRYSEDKNYEMLMNIYNSAVARQSKKAAG